MKFLLHPLLDVTNSSDLEVKVLE